MHKVAEGVTEVTLSSSVVSNCEIAGLLHGHWKNYPNAEPLSPNGDADFFDDKGGVLASRRNNKLRVFTELLPKLASVCSK